MSDKDFAFPKERAAPLVDGPHGRNAVARFDQVEGISDKERDQPWERISKRPSATTWGLKLTAGVSSSRAISEEEEVGEEVGEEVALKRPGQLLHKASSPGWHQALGSTSITSPIPPLARRN